MLFNRKQLRCSICDEDIPKGCGLKYRMKTRRYAPDGFYCNMPIHGAVCYNCLKTIKKMVLDCRNVELARKVKVG